MLRKLFITFVLILSLFFVSPVESLALNENIVITDSFYILSEQIDYYDEEKCTGDDSILGNINNPNSVAWLLDKFLGYVKIIGPILVVLLSSIDFAKVIASGDEKAMNGALKNLGIRLMLAILLFFIPLIVNFLLGLFGFISDSTCGLQ